MPLVHKNIIIKGKVQGVYFRASAKYAADRLSVTGIVRNEPDGSVFAEAEGDEDNVQKFITWCKTGSSASKVISVFASDDPVKGYRSFEIVR